MRSVIYGLLVVGALFLAALVVTWFRVQDPARPDVAVGLAALLSATLIDPFFLAASIAGFGLTYWLTKRP
jgi:hypothetical protein